jgi:hypothetical protein
LEDLNIRPEFWLRPIQQHPGEFIMSHALYTLTAQEKRKFIATIKELRTPKGYVGSLHRRISDGRLWYLKSRDFHVLIQQVSNF